MSSESEGIPSARGPSPAQSIWLFNAMLVVAVPALALLWWAVAFLPWTLAPVPPRAAWPPSLPGLFTDLQVAVFGPLGASVVVFALLRRTGPAVISVLLGLGVSAWVTLSRGADIHGIVVNTTERQTMVGVCAVAGLVGLTIGAAAIRSLLAFGFLGLLAVAPLTSLVAVLLFDPRTDTSQLWLTRLALVVLLVLIAWRRWSFVLLWPIFFVLFWLLNLAMSAVGYGAQTLRHPGGSQVSLDLVAEAMQVFVRSAWRVLLESSWHTFWPALACAALLVMGRFVWRSLRPVGA